MKLKIVIPSLILLLCVGLSDADAQFGGNKYKKRNKRNKAMSNYTNRGGGRFRPYNFVSFNVNALNYYGDLAPVNRAASTDISFTRPGFGGEIGARFHQRIAVRAGFNYGRIKGDDITSDPEPIESAGRYARNLSFRSDIKEIHLAFEFFLLPTWGGPNVRPDFNVYLAGGIAVFHHEPKALVPNFDYSLGDQSSTIAAPQAGEWVRLRKLGTEGQFIEGLDVKTYSPIQLSIPIALGVRMRLPGPFSASLEMGYRYLFTDYIDDVSGKFVSFDQFDDPLARIMSDRSAEPFGAWSGEDRGIQTTSEILPDGIRYYVAGGEDKYRIGGGIADGSRRGNPNDNDMIFMTSLKLTMILGQVRKSAKFR
ncbi:MAG: hypothetical protein CMB80_25365 [Flammeovirgaceae bacterium]|nr:hypothetical protein [Flammeovirgaceae bacterium]MBE63843.1 hypothetical protein [Flammeovirgaceae bacterium]HCX23211.1 hypothetical protein [Cytophagales bacterium]|tara:strand:+ start:20073 stop:21170 length:1098 start_codon:yes stop_codon:yes gene_type:complete